MRSGRDLTEHLMRRQVDRRWPISSGCEIVRRCGANRELGITISNVNYAARSPDMETTYVLPSGKGHMNGYIAMSIAVLRLPSFSVRYRNHLRNGTSSRSGGSRTFSALAKIKKVAAKSSSVFCFSSSCHYDRHDENGRAHSRQSSMRPLLDLYEGTVGVRSPVGGVQFHCGRHWAADAMFTVGGRGLIDFFSFRPV